MRATLYTDGGSRGNPGLAAAAYVLYAGSHVVLYAEVLGVATNNQAEYRALIAGLKKARELNVSELDVIADSDLVVNQMTGAYKVKAANMIPLSIEAQELSRSLPQVTYRWISRAENTLSDRLVNEALDAAEERLS